MDWVRCAREGEANVSWFEQLVIGMDVNGCDATSCCFMPEEGLEGEGGEVDASCMGYLLSDYQEGRREAPP